MANATTDIQAFVIETLASFGTDAEITPEAEIKSLDIDSLDLAEFSQVVDEQLGVQLESKDLKDIVTVGDVITLVQSRTEAAA